MWTKEAADKVYADAKALCYGAAMEAATPFERKRLEDFTVPERQMIDRIAEWMGSRDCEIVNLKAQLAGAEGVLSMTVDRLGGIVEGHPTSRINFLQRIDELRAIEAKLKMVAQLSEEHDAACRVAFGTDNITHSGRAGAQLQGLLDFCRSLR